MAPTVYTPLPMNTCPESERANHLVIMRAEISTTRNSLRNFYRNQITKVNVGSTTYQNEQRLVKERGSNVFLAHFI